MSRAVDKPDESLYRLIASQLVSGVSKAEIAKSLNTTTQRINNLLKDEQFKSVMRELTEDVVGAAVSTLKSAMADRTEQALRVIDHHLMQNNLEAVKLLFKSLGLENVAPQVAQQGSLTVVLPSFDGAKTLEAEVKDVKNE